MSTSTTIIMKTLPMKFKSMHYAVLAFITQSEELSADTKVSLIAKLPVMDTIENQISFYEKMVDFKTVEKDIVKPMIKKVKQDAVVKTKKPRATKKPKEPTPTSDELALRLPTLATEVVLAVAATVDVPKVDVPKVEGKKVVVKKVPKAKVVAVTTTTTAPAAAPAAAPALEKKKRAVKKVVPKPSAIPEQDETDEQPEEMLLTDEMKEEPYLNQKLEKPVLKRSLNTVEASESWLIIREGVKYWTTDEAEQDGIVYKYEQDEEGDGEPGAIVGKLVEGKLFLS